MPADLIETDGNVWEFGSAGCCSEEVGIGIYDYLKSKCDKFSFKIILVDGTKLGKFAEDLKEIDDSLLGYLTLKEV